MGNYFVENFQSIIQTSNLDIFDNLYNLISPAISNEENEFLTKQSATQEIEITINKMNSLKALGPDGMPTLFHKKYWNIIKEDLIKLVQNFFITGHLLKEWNMTFITLIPKKKIANNFVDFRPISLLYTCYNATK